MACCQTNTKKSEGVISLTDNTARTFELDSLTAEPISEEDAIIEFEETEFEISPNTEKILVDRVHYFPSTNEAYVWVGFKGGYDWKALDSLKKHADSLIFQDGEITRTRYPFDKASKYLDLEMLDGIVIFNYSHESQGTSKLKRIEYFEDVLGDQFIAILETPKDLKGDEFYGINGTTNFITSLSSRNIDDQNLKKSILNFLDLKSKYDWRYGSIQIKPYNLTYAFYSFLAEGETEKSYLIEAGDMGLKKMAETTNEYSIWELSPVTVQINYRPVLLLWVGYPETGSEWFTPAIFDGKKFQITNNRIIYLSEYLSKSDTSSANSTRCNIDVLVTVSQNLNSLSVAEIDKFLKTFSDEFRNNVEHSEWSNELLFGVIYAYPAETIRLLNDSTYEFTTIYDKLASPLNDKYMPVDIIERIKKLGLSEPIADSMLNSLKVAQSKQ